MGLSFSASGHLSDPCAPALNCSSCFPVSLLCTEKVIFLDAYCDIECRFLYETPGGVLKIVAFQFVYKIQGLRYVSL